MPTFLIKNVAKWWATTLPTLHGFDIGVQRFSFELAFNIFKQERLIQ
ncbi:MAG: hypothetical protein KAI83_04990 [Thiomargarita sp.]|nr:hypothetical protein [Thiomargarita sp.]